MENQQDIIDQNQQRPTIKQASILFTIAVMLFVTLGIRAQSYDLMKGVVFTEFVLIAGSALVFLKIKGYSIKYALRLNRVGFMPYFLAFCIMLISIPVVSIINLLNLSLIKQIFGRVVINQPPVATNLLELILYVAIIGGSAGICEEILFRGIVQRAYEGLGWKKGILLAAFLFGLMHMDFQKLLGTFLLGAIIGYMVYRTKSLFVGIFAHFCNNSLAVLISYGYTQIKKTDVTSTPTGGDIDFSVFTKMSNIQLVVTIITFLFLIGIFVSMLVIMFIIFNMYTKRYLQEEETIENSLSFMGLIYTLPAVILIVIVYFYQGYRLAFVKVPMLEQILKFLMGK